MKLRAVMACVVGKGSTLYPISLRPKSNPDTGGPSFCRIPEKCVW